MNFLFNTFRASGPSQIDVSEKRFDNVPDVYKMLKEWKPTKAYLVAIDSDGCVFDTMGIKQRECFCPMMIAYFGLQPVAEAARECKMFADLFSKTRGANRHKTMIRILAELLPSHPMVKKKKFNVPGFDYYRKWVDNPQSVLSNAGLKSAIEGSPDMNERQELNLVLQWSVSVDEMVAKIIRGIPPFCFVRKSLDKMSRAADIMVCSATPIEAIRKEWTEHELIKYVNIAAGQEMGTKAQQLSEIKDNYDKNKIIMLGDALGDLDAAKKCDIQFYPIIPGTEDESWKRYFNEIADKFIGGKYADDCENSCISEFMMSLKDEPSWQATIKSSYA